MFLDPDGRDITITGPYAEQALIQIQQYVGSQLKMSIVDNKLVYEQKEDEIGEKRRDLSSAIFR